MALKMERTTDQLIQELKPLLAVSNIIKGQDIPSRCSSILNAAKESVTTLAGIKKRFQKQVNEIATQHWVDHLSQLQVQRKFSDIVSLEKENQTWKIIMNDGLISGQLSFLLKVGSDTLPTPMNLRRMIIQCDSRSPFCKAPRPTTAHILNGFPIGLSQGRYPWRYDSVLSHIVRSLSRLLHPTYKMLASLDRWRVEDSSATIPLSTMSSPLRPDLVVMEN